MTLRLAIERSWLKPNLLTLALRPISLIYRGLFALRSQSYKTGVFSSYRASVPVVVIGNLTVGGTGKTPLLIHTVNVLKEHGYTPGVISRGYGSKAPSYPYHVTDSCVVIESGDEPALIMRRTNVPVMVGPDRKASIQALLSLDPCIDVIVSDDGLQHLALQRDIEVCLLDATSPQENQYLLPAGPYRESLSRIDSVDLVVRHGASKDGSDEFAMNLCPGKPKLVQANKQLEPQQEPIFDVNRTFHAVAGIGNPKRFFDTCSALGYRFIEHAFADHHDFTEEDLTFDGGPVLMTEKDAVKCQHFADARHWFLPVDATLSDQFNAMLLARLASLKQI